MNRITHFLRNYGLAIVIALGSGLCSAGLVTFNARADPYTPVHMRPIKFITAQPFHVGQEVTILNGLCNDSSDILQSTTIVGWQEVGKDTLVARKIVVRPKLDENGNLGVQPLPEPMPPGCVGIKDGISEPITGPLPQSLGPGKWSLYILMTINGPNGKQQKLTHTSETITVVP